MAKGTEKEQREGAEVIQNLLSWAADLQLGRELCRRPSRGHQLGGDL